MALTSTSSGSAKIARGTTLAVSGVAKSFGSTKALKGVSLEVEKGSIHALLGGNGSGKSTLIKILAGVYRADAGTVTLGGSEHRAQDLTPDLARSEHLRFVHQNPSTFENMSVAENLAIGNGYERRGLTISWREQRRRAEKLLERFEIDASPRTELGRLNPATQTMVAVARALQDVEEGGSSTLVLDEPTASLPYGEVALLLSSLRRYAAAGQAILFVTHRLEEVCEVADSATVLRDGAVVCDLDKPEIDHERLVEAIIGGPAKELDVRSASPVVSKKPILRARNLSGGAVQDVSLEVSAGEIVGVAGLLGSGRSTLLRLLFGAQPVSGGEIELDDRRVSVRSPRQAMSVGIGLAPGDRASEAAFPMMTLEENISMPMLGRYTKGALIHHRLEHRQTNAVIDAYGIVTGSRDAPFSTLSGGNQQKVVMARTVEVGKRILLLDEPTQGVDVGARREIWATVRRVVEAGAGALVVSSDLEELGSVCDRALVMVRGRIVGELEGAEIDEQTLDRMILQQRAVA